MTLPSGTRLGPYEVTAPLGVGGMGEVYRATDTNLKRQVAIKVLPASVAADADRLARFQREAEVLAALNHPHIAAIYGLERTPECTALVMELVEGDDLSAVIARGPIAWADALPIAKQIAEALEAAHEQGIIHRDLKPANIKLRADGTVKVLDFGLAKALDPVGASSVDAMSSPTLTTPAMTAMGMILGTAAYMSPEQASGRPVDRRSDMWAFGVVFCEMLTGRRVFDGETVSHVLASVLKDAPDLTAVPADTPAPVRRLLRRCLEKHPKLRMDSAAAARLEIDDALNGRGATEAAGAPSSSAAGTALPTSRQSRPLVAAALAAGVLLTGAITWTMWPTAAPGQVRRSILVAPDDLVATANRPVIGIAPDAGAVVYATRAGLHVRAADELEGRLLPGTDEASQPVFSPDGRQVAYFRAGALMRIPVAGGGPVVIASDLSSVSLTDWTDESTLLFAGPDGIYQVPASGGRPDRIIAAAEGTAVASPQRLPGGSVLFTQIDTTDGEGRTRIVVQTPGRENRAVLVDGVGARYLPTGHLVFQQGAALLGIAFDVKRLTVSGAAVSLVQNLRQRPNGSNFILAASGELIYWGATGSATEQRTLAWVDRRGQETAIPAPPRAYRYPRASPDGTRIALEIADEEQDIWVWDLARTTLARVTFKSDVDQVPIWSTDGRSLFFRSQLAGALERGLFRISADGTGTAERLTTSRNLQTPSSLTPDGRRLLFFEIVRGAGNDNDILQVEVAQGHTVTPLVQEASAFNGVVSPDGRWLAYDANDSGTREVYVRPYPDVNSGRYMVSIAGGGAPVWSPDSRELFYATTTGALMRVGVQAGESLRATIPEQVLPEGSIARITRSPVRSYDISHDGRKFLVLKDVNASLAPAFQIVDIQGFDELLKRLVPGK